eukprot:scaffold5554_cov130-Isochrysis_galbana.AAC.2
MSIASYMLAILVRLANRSRNISLSQPRPVSRAWFSPCRSRDVRNRAARRRFVSLRFVYLVHVQPPMRQTSVFLVIHRAPTLTLTSD